MMADRKFVTNLRKPSMVQKTEFGKCCLKEDAEWDLGEDRAGGEHGCKGLIRE